MRRISRRGVIGGAVGAAGLAAAGCTNAAGASDARWAAPGSTLGPGASPSAAPIQLTVSPAADATNVSPTEPVVVTATGGKLQSVTVAAGGKTVDGSLDANGQTWRSSGTLSYGQTYTVTASLVDSTGAPVQKTCSFSTLKPAATVSVSFQANALAMLKTGGTYGVGQPVIVYFSRAVSDKSAAEKAISIQTSPSVEGKFFWLDTKTVHWRPAQYWAKGTTITVNVNILGVNLGGNVYGAANASTHFTIGRKLVAISDNNTHRTQVFIDDQLVRDMACSNGKGGYTMASDGKTQIHFWTQTGPHVVLEKDQTVTMSSASYGITNKSDPNYYSEDVQLCTRISYSGEYLHSAPWNNSLGKANLSHGCINLSPADAKWVFDNFMVGDVVEVRNTPKSLPIWDGLGDWNVSFDKYGS